MERFFDRSRLLLGADVMHELQISRVIVFGIGGVGSWAAEALVRTGLQSITIVDCDKVDPTNVNRQVPATASTVGESKVEAMKSHLEAICPDVTVYAIDTPYTPDTANGFPIQEYDYVIDAIDSVRDKALLIRNVTACRHTKLFSSMGAALKLDPTRIRVGEFSKVTGCRLAAAIRHTFKRDRMYPMRKFQCVYSDELQPNRGETSQTTKILSGDDVIAEKRVNGSLVHITAIFGMTLAGLVIEDIVRKTAKPQ